MKLAMAIAGRVDRASTATPRLTAQAPTLLGPSFSPSVSTFWRVSEQQEQLACRARDKWRASWARRLQLLLRQQQQQLAQRPPLATIARSAALRPSAPAAQAQHAVHQMQRLTRSQLRPRRRHRTTEKQASVMTGPRRAQAKGQQQKQSRCWGQHGSRRTMPLAN